MIKIIFKDSAETTFDPAFSTNTRPTTCHRLLKNPSIMLLKEKLINATIPFKQIEYPDWITKQIVKLRIENPDIIFKPADKNLGLVVMDLYQYDNLIQEHLTDENTYSKIQSPSTAAFSRSAKCRGIESSLNSLKIPMLNMFKDSPDFILKFVKKLFSSQPQYNLPAFHVMPKLHKPGKISSRPIVGATNWYTTPISKLLDHYIKPHIDKTHILKDTKQWVLTWAIARRKEKLKVNPRLMFQNWTKMQFQ
jgi:hypothetical protein